MSVAVAAVVTLGGGAVAAAVDKKPPTLAVQQEPKLPDNPHTRVVDKLEHRLRLSIKSARELAAESRRTQEQSEIAGVAASQAIVDAHYAATQSEAARAEAARTQLMVDRWAAAAYRSTSVDAWEIAALAGEDIVELLHSSGLRGFAGDFQARLIERARDAEKAAVAANERAQAQLVRAQLLLDVAATNEAIAEDQRRRAREAVVAVQEELEKRRLQESAFAQRLAIDLALGVPLILNIPVSGSLLQRASKLKDVRPFAPGSGPNSNERMSEWLALDVTVLPGTPRAFAVSMLDDYGWGLDQWPCLDRLWWHESGWDPRQSDAMQGTGYGELNPDLTWGIPQANPAIKMANPDQDGGPDWATNPMTQIRWGLWYIKNAGGYESPCGAWEAWRARAATGSYGWY